MAESKIKAPDDCYKSGDRIVLRNCKYFGRTTNARDTAYMAITLPKRIADGVTPTLKITDAIVYYGAQTINISNVTPTVSGISPSAGQILITFPLGQTLSSVQMLLLDQTNGEVTFS